MRSEEPTADGSIHPPDILAVIFDLDGVIVDTEPWWSESRRAVAARLGGRWTEEDEAGIKGANSAEWARAMHRRLARLAPPADAIERAVIAELLERYRRGPVPAIAAGVAAARRLATRWPLAIASSSPPAVIAAAVRAVGLQGGFRALVSSDEVGIGKPSPQVYLEAARRLGVDPVGCLVIEDSPNGVQAAHSAGMRVVMVPGRSMPGSQGALSADLVVESLDGLDGTRLRMLGAT